MIKCDNEKNKKSMQVFIRDDTTRVYQVSDDTTLQELRAMVEEKEGKPSSHHRLVFNGKILMNPQNITLSEIGVKNNSTLHLYMSWSTDIISPRCFDFCHVL